MTGHGYVLPKGVGNQVELAGEKIPLSFLAWYKHNQWRTHPCRNHLQDLSGLSSNQANKFCTSVVRSLSWCIYNSIALRLFRYYNHHCKQPRYWCSSISWLFACNDGYAWQDVQINFIVIIIVGGISKLQIWANPMFFNMYLYLYYYCTLFTQVNDLNDANPTRVLLGTAILFQAGVMLRYVSYFKQLNVWSTYILSLMIKYYN